MRPARTRLWFLPTVRATTPEVNVVVLNLEFLRIDLGPGKVVEARILDIHDAAAVEADKVMMLAEVRVEASHGAWVADPGDQAERNKGSQDAVNRHAGDLGELGAHGTVKLLGGGVISAVQYRIENSAALGGNRQASFAMGGQKAVHSLSFVRRAHDFQMRTFTR